MIRIFNHFVPKVASALLLMEFLIFMTSPYLSTGLGIFRSAHTSNMLEHIFSGSLIFAAVMVLSMSAFGMYRLDIDDGHRQLAIRITATALLGFATMNLLFYFWHSIYLGRGVIGGAIIISASSILLLRILTFKSYMLAPMKSRVIVLGSGPLAKECSRLIMTNVLSRKYHIVGFVPFAAEEPCVSSASILPSNESLTFMAKKYNADEIVVSVENRRCGSFPIDELLKCKLEGVKVTGAAAFFEREACQIRIDSLQPGWLVFGDGFDQSFLRTACKRLFDIVVSLLIFMLTLPIMLITALYVYLEDRGPIFYQQERVGKDGHTFMIIKFRSMRNDAEKTDHPQWAAANDPRTTRVGQIIRKLRIDELPQLLNVIKGEMSFVGPRPERPYFVNKLRESIPFYNARHSIKPGLTGFAQVRYPYGASVDDAVQKLQYDLYYVKNHSLFLDLLILIDTVQVVLFGRGGR